MTLFFVSSLILTNGSLTSSEDKFSTLAAYFTGLGLLSINKDLCNGINFSFISFAFDNKFKKAFLFSCNLNNEIKNKVNHEVRLQKAKNLYSIPRLNNPKVKWIPLDSFEYLCRVKWLPDNKRLSVQTMNRSQNKLDLFFVDRATGENIEKIITETDSGWVNINDDLYFLDNSFIWQSERNGYAHLYQFSYDGKEFINKTNKKFYSSQFYC